MRESGSFVFELLLEEAPVTVATFARLAEAGYYNGLTFHRIAPNFVLQGGSPGANEFVGTPGYIRDELGLVSHERGTLGISTRGRDTGDGQIFINLVNNYRLDHDYTVFARIVEGIDNVDRIQEGDVMEAVVIQRQ
jgi:cyclophilin family peptidyl-prolyl cis-trans isomerase